MDYNWHVEVFIVERCADIQREITSFRQTRQVLPDVGWFGKNMLSLGLWLVAIGERLCQRYEVSETKTVLNGF